MHYGYKCDTTGLVEFVDGPGDYVCPHCSDKHEAYAMGVPSGGNGVPFVIQDSITPYFDWSAGCKIDSKSQRRRVYAELGMFERSAAEVYRKKGVPEGMVSGKTISYSGQDNRSRRNGDMVVRTKTGQVVI